MFRVMSQSFFPHANKSKCPTEGVRIQLRVIFQDWLIKISFAEVAARLIDGTFAPLWLFGKAVPWKFWIFEILRLGAGIKNFQGAARVFDESSFEKYCRKAIIKRCFIFLIWAIKTFNIHMAANACLLAAKSFTFVVFIFAVWSYFFKLQLAATHE